MPDVVCVGILVADIVAYPLVGLPEEGKLKLVENMELHTGGCAVNTGTALKKLGVDVAVVGKVGDDPLGDFLVSQLEKRDINIQGVVRDKTRKTSATMVFVSETGERTFLHYTGANATMRPEDIRWEVARGARVFHLGGFFLMPGFDGDPAAEVLRHAKSLGLMTSLDTAWDDQGHWMKLLAPCMPYIDVFISSLSEAQMLSGEVEPPRIAAKLADMGPRLIAIKMGPDGSYILSPEFEGFIPPFVVKAVDGTGAGDAFVAGFLTGLLMGWDIKKTARFANAVGALCVSCAGASTGIRTLSETLAFMGEEKG